MDDTMKKEKEFLRHGIQEAFLCAELLTKYVEKGNERDTHLKNLEGLVQNYCLLDYHLDIRPGLVSKMSQEENKKTAQRENSASEVPVEDNIDYKTVLSQKVSNAIKKHNVKDHVKFKDYIKKVSTLINASEGTGDDDLMVTEETETLLDPISKTELVDPVITIKCKHRFSRKTITDHLQSARHQIAKCPYMGCVEKLTIEDLEDDLITAQIVKRSQIQRQLH